MSLDAKLEAARPETGNIREALHKFLESVSFQIVMIVIILINAAIMGCDASPTIHEQYGTILDFLDHFIIGIFVVELLTKIAVGRWQFFSNGWNLFDLAVVALALFPMSGPFAILRSLRAFRLFRLLSILPKARMTVDAMISAVSGLVTTFAMLALVFYVFVVLANGLFRDGDPELFGSLPSAAFSLYEVMIFFGAASEIINPVSQHHAWAWLFFGPFVLTTSFALLNLFIGVISGEIQEQREKAKLSEAEAPGQAAAAGNDGELSALRAELRSLSAQITALDHRLSGTGSARDQPPA